MIKYSIIIPIYNMEKSIEETVKSLLDQTYKNYEIILVDDGSKDDTGKICDKLSKENEKIKTIHTDNCGAGPARNRGIKEATGDYIFFPDADDVIDKNIFEILNNVLTKQKYDLIVFGYKCINIKATELSVKQYPNCEFNADNIRKNYSDFCTMIDKYGIQGAPWNKLFSLKIIKEHEIYFPSLRRHQDEAFIGRYVNCIKNVRFIPNVLYKYYTNDLKKEWQKYPIDYIDAVNGLFEERKKNLLIWNEKDYETHDKIYKEYICNFIKAMELSFSPKFNFNHKKRMNWIRNNFINNKMNEIERCKNLRWYHKLAYFCIKQKHIVFFYFLIWMKVKVEKIK